MKQHNLTKNIVVQLDDNITYKHLLGLRKKDEGVSHMLREMVLRFVAFKQPDGTFAKVSQNQYDKFPLWLGRELDKFMNELFSSKAEPDADDRFTVTLPSGQIARYRVPLTEDQLNAEKWATKHPEMLTAYIMEAVFKFENMDGEFLPRIVEDIVDMSVQDGYAMSELLNAQEDSDVFFLELAGGAYESTSSDLSTTDSASKKSKK